MTWTLLIPENELPDDCCAILNGAITKGSGHLLSAWFRRDGKQEIAKCEVKMVPAEVTPAPLELSDEIEVGCADCGGDSEKCTCDKGAAIGA